MAASPNFQKGVGPVEINGVWPALRMGNSATITTGAASANIALPTDPNGNLYSVYLVQAVGSASWWIFCTSGADAAVAAAANTLAAVPAQYPCLVVVPPGATNVAAIQDTAAGHLTFTGIY